MFFVSARTMGAENASRFLYVYDKVANLWAFGVKLRS